MFQGSTHVLGCKAFACYCQDGLTSPPGGTQVARSVRILAYVCVCISAFLCPFIIGEYLDCFCILAIVNNASVKRGLCIFLTEPYFSSFGCIARSRIAELSGNSLFNFLRNLHTVFQRNCTILHTTKCRAPVSPCPHQHVFCSVWL